MTRNKKTPYQNIVDFVMTNYGDISYLNQFMKDNGLERYEDFDLFQLYIPVTTNSPVLKDYVSTFHIVESETKVPSVVTGDFSNDYNFDFLN